MKAERTPLSAISIAEKRSRIERDMLDPRNFALGDRALARYHDVCHLTIAKYRDDLADKILHPDNPLNLPADRIAALEAVITSGLSLVIRADGSEYYYPRRKPIGNPIGNGNGNGNEKSMSVNQLPKLSNLPPAHVSLESAADSPKSIGNPIGNGNGNGNEKSMSVNQPIGIGKSTFVKQLIREAAHAVRDLYFTPDVNGRRPVDSSEMPEGFWQDNAVRIREIIDTICVRERVDFNTITDGAKEAFIKTPFPIDYFNVKYEADKVIDIVENAFDDYQFVPSRHTDSAAAWDNEHGPVAAKKLARRSHLNADEISAVLSELRTMFINMVDTKGDAW